MRKAGEEGTLVCMHAENGVVIDELVKLALAAGHIEPKYHALTRPTRLEGEGAHRALAIAEVARAPVYIVHLSCHECAHGVAARPGARGDGARRDLPAVPAAGHERLRRAGFRRRQVRHDAAPAGEVEPGRAVARPADQGSRRHLHRPLSLLPARAEGAGARRLQPHSERRTRRRESDEPDLPPRGQRRAHRRQPVRGADLHRAGPHLRHVPAQGDHRRRVGRGHRRLRPGAGGDHQQQRPADAPYERRLQRLRGLSGARIHRDPAVARAGSGR